MDYGHEQTDIAAETPRDRQPPLCLRWETRGIWSEVDRLLGMERPEAAIATDIVLNALDGKAWTSYSRDKNVYHKGDAPSVLWTYGNVVPTVDVMERRGLILHDKRAPSPKGCGWRSALSPKPILVEAVQEAIRIRGKPVPVRPTSTVVLRDAKGIPLELPRTRKMLRMAKQVETVNRFMEENGEEARFRRIFSETLERGGRWYCLGGAHQVKSGEERLLIRIGGERSAEVDYRTLHPAMLYAERGLKLDGDAYDVGDWPRELTKLALLVLINASDLDQAIHAIAGKEAMRGIWTPGSEDARWAAKRLIREIRKKHRAIEDAFCSDSGARLMRKDSDITTAIMKRMVAEGEVCLPVHDSYIVRESAADLLQETMLEAAAAAGLHDIELKVSTAPEEDRSRRDNPLNENDNRPIVLTYPYTIVLPLPPSPVLQDRQQDSDERVRPSEARELDSQAEGRTSFPSSSNVSETLQDPILAASIPFLDASAEAPTFDSAPGPSEDATPVESPAGSLDVAPCAPSSVRASSHSLPWDRSFILASLEARRHDRAVAAARAVAGPAVSPDLDWSANLGFGLAQNTERGSCWTWSQPGRRECVVHLVNAAAETVLAVVDQAAAGRVVEAYLRTLAGDGPRLRINVSYAGRYDLSLPFEENVALYEPVSDVLYRPSLVPGAPDNDNEEPTFSTDPVWFDDEEHLPLAA